jgi:deoxyadenosine/deoxycytidine kinase
MSNQIKALIISIEGNIGSGKSTLIDMMKNKWSDKHPNYIFLKEPVDIWENIKDKNDDENILQKFYKDSNKYAFSFQMLAYMTFHQQLIKAINESNENTIIFCERSMDSSKAIFAKMLYDSGAINNIEYQVLKMFYYQIKNIPIDIIAYIDSTVQTCYERIKYRARTGEHNIQIKYLKKCEKYHREWLSNKKFILNKNYIRIDDTKDSDFILNYIHEFLKNYKKPLYVEPIKDGIFEIDLLEEEDKTEEHSDSHFQWNNNSIQEPKLTCNNCKQEISKKFYYYHATKFDERLEFCYNCYNELYEPYLNDGWNFYRLYFT